tara:strand:- start:791 stop:1282 length:492 start_codon:yes stop_codon:yes gene_type:complete
MKNKKITRKEFISKTTKCAGGLICTPMILSIFQSCDKPNLINSIDETTLYISECPCHQAQFDQEGNVVQNPIGDWDGQEIPPLTQYSVLINEESFTINNGDVEIEFSLSDHIEIQSVGGISSLENNEIDSSGLLLYRKSETEIIALSRECTHNGCTVSEFDNI